MTSVIWLLSTHFIIEPPREQPAHTEHVRGGAKGAVAETVFALAKFARAMVHRDFDETETGAFHQRGNETMHAFERQQRHGHFANPRRWRRSARRCIRIGARESAHRARSVAPSDLPSRHRRKLSRNRRR